MICQSATTSESQSASSSGMVPYWDAISLNVATTQAYEASSQTLAGIGLCHTGGGTMRITYDHHFAAPIDRVVALLSNEEFAKERARAAGAAHADVLIDHFDDGAFTVVIRRSTPADSIPPELRGLVGGQLVARYTEAWAAAEHNGDPSDREGTFALEIPGTPGHARGAVVLKPIGDGTAFGLAGEVQATLPLFGALVERTIAEAIERALPLELATADAWLARG